MTYDPTLESLNNNKLAKDYIYNLYNNNNIQEWITDAKSENNNLIIPQYEMHSD